MLDSGEGSFGERGDLDSGDVEKLQGAPLSPPTISGSQAMGQDVSPIRLANSTRV